MPVQHTATQGECISSLADRYGFFPDTIWNDPANAELKRKRKDPNILCPGDVVVIPDKRGKEETGGTGRKHRFRKKNTPAMLRIRFLDEEDRPRGNMRYTLEIDGHFSEGSTDSDGKIEHPIPPGAKKGVLLLENEDIIPLSFGGLDPVENTSGVQARLMNLGFDCGGVTGEMDPRTREALKAFQGKHGLSPSGRVDEDTKAKLLRIHGS